MAAQIVGSLRENRQDATNFCNKKFRLPKFGRKKSSTSSTDINECRVTFDEYNREMSTASPSSSSSLRLTRFCVAPEYCVAPPTRLQPEEKNCSSAVTLRCRFCTIKRASLDEPFGFTISFVAKMTTGASLVDFVQTKSPAEKAGLLTGDRIMTVNGKRVNEWTDVEKLMENVLDAEIAVSRADRVSLEVSERSSTGSKDSLSAKLESSNAKGVRAKVCDKKTKKFACKLGNTAVNADEEESHQHYYWGTNTIIDRYPEARAMLRMLGRGPYSTDFRDYGYLSSY